MAPCKFGVSCADASTPTDQRHGPKYRKQLASSAGATPPVWELFCRKMCAFTTAGGIGRGSRARWNRMAATQQRALAHICFALLEAVENVEDKEKL